MSFLIPTRNKITWLRRTLESVIRTCSDRNQIEILLRMDDDDNERLQIVDELEQLYGAHSIIGSRGSGYNNISSFITDLLGWATGQWAWFLDDDAWIEGNTWQKQLSELDPTDHGPVANTETYQLGLSKYTCGPKGLAPGIIIPMVMAKSFKTENPVDVCWHSYAIQNHCQFVILKGVTLCHDGRPR